MAIAEHEEVSKARAKRALKTGGCAALLCKAECVVFAFVRVMDGYPLCACGHTQDVHARGPVGASKTSNG